MSLVDGRRRFFRSFLGEMVSFVHEVGGTPQFRLDQLAELPDEVLNAMQPVMLAAAPDSLDQTGRWVVARFDGQRSIAALGEELAVESSIDLQTAQQRVRAIFLALAKAMICVPASAPGGEMS